MDRDKDVDGKETWGPSLTPVMSFVLNCAVGKVSRCAIFFYIFMSEIVNKVFRFKKMTMHFTNFEQSEVENALNTID